MSRISNKSPRRKLPPNNHHHILWLAVTLERRQAIYSSSGHNYLSPLAWPAHKHYWGWNVILYFWCSKTAVPNPESMFAFALLSGAHENIVKWYVHEYVQKCWAGSLYYHRVMLIPSWRSKYMYYKVSDEIMYPFSNFITVRPLKFWFG